MDKDKCVVCGIDIYGREGRFKCPIHGDHKMNYNIGKLELVEEEPPCHYQGA